MTSPSPRELGFRMPAEWEPHESTWISWPHNEETWPDELDHVETTMAHLVKVVSRSETVRINVVSEQQKRRAKAALDTVGAVGAVRFHSIPTNDAWVRDYGPTFLVGPRRELAAACWGFNSWGGKYPPYDLDDGAARRMSDELGVRCFEADMILEGGSIEVNGTGMLITTESCLLNPNRNPQLSRGQIEERLKAFLGVRHVIWLAQGIAGDDTDGHIDDLARFVGARSIVAAVEDDPRSENYDILRDNLDRLRAATTLDGRTFDVLELPMPKPICMKGERMPASYANFYVGNRTVLVPAYGDRSDHAALSVLRRCFPTRDVIGMDCRSLIWGLGAFHCLTQQVPRGM